VLQTQTHNLVILLQYAVGAEGVAIHHQILVTCSSVISLNPFILGGATVAHSIWCQV